MRDSKGHMPGKAKGRSILSLDLGMPWRKHYGPDVGETALMIHWTLVGTQLRISDHVSINNSTAQGRAWHRRLCSGGMVPE